MANETAALVDNPLRTERGIVISDKRQKTITVEVRRQVRHPQYGKIIFRSTNLHAHDEKNEAKLGDTVEVQQARPISRLKRWRLAKVLVRAADLSGLQIKEVEVPGKKKAVAAAAPAEKKD